jgi:hypothetical protein
MICIPKLALEIQDLLLPATVLSPRLDNPEEKMHIGRLESAVQKCLGKLFLVPVKCMTVIARIDSCAILIRNPIRIAIALS